MKGEAKAGIDDRLYRAILARRSVRRYDNTPLSDALLAEIGEMARNVWSLVGDNRFEVLLKSTAGIELTAALGAYGRIVNPPHILLPYATDEEHVLEDLGYRAEQIAVRLTAMGLGSCFIGALGREEAVRAYLGLSEGARTAAFLVFGRPSEALAGRAVNRLMRLSTGAGNKLSADRVFFQGSFAAPSAPPAGLAPLIEAARNAPSAVDAQPWRFLWQGGRLHLFVKRHNRRYGRGPAADYRLHDGGTCMANVSLALAALGLGGGWQLYEGGERDIPEHPPELQPLARLTLSHDLSPALP